MNITLNKDITRRSLMGAMGAMGAMAAVGPVIAMADEGGSTSYDGGSSNILDQQSAQGEGLPWSGSGSEAGDWLGTPDDIKFLGGCTMPLDELNRRRQLYMDSKSEYTKEDGTVVPAVYVKAMALLNTYGFGIGNDRGDNGYDTIMNDLTEDEAQAYIDMPNGVAFNPAEFATYSGYSLEDAEKYCTALADKAWIIRFTNDRGTFYAHVPAVQGVIEYHDNDSINGWNRDGMYAPDMV